MIKYFRDIAIYCSIIFQFQCAYSVHIVTPRQNLGEAVGTYSESLFKNNEDTKNPGKGMPQSSPQLQYKQEIDGCKCKNGVDKRKCRIETCSDIILWAGYEWPDHFDSRLIKDTIDKEQAFEHGLKLVKERAIDGELLDQATLAGYYYERREFKKSLYWAHKCAEGGSPEGMSILRAAYAQGSGVVQDLEESMKWCFLAAAAGSEPDIKILKEINSKNLSNDTVEAGRKSAQAWVKDHQHIFFNPGL